MRRFVQSFAIDSKWPDTMEATAREALSSGPARFNIAVRKSADVLISADRVPVVETMQWGLIPAWSKTPETRYTTMTARVDRAPRSRIFGRPWKLGQRCVVPLNGYYKWDRTVAPAVPYFIQASSGEVLLAAGLWDVASKLEPPLASFTILTDSNDAIPAPLVPDGPVFLGARDWKRWLGGRLPFPLAFLKSARQPELEAYRVSRAVGNRERDDYTLLEPWLPGSPSDDWNEAEDEDEDESDD